MIPLMALNSLYCADVPLSNYSLTHYCVMNESEITVVEIQTLRSRCRKQHGVLIASPLERFLVPGCFVVLGC